MPRSKRPDEYIQDKLFTFYHLDERVENEVKELRLKLQELNVTEDERYRVSLYWAYHTRLLELGDY